MTSKPQPQNDRRGKSQGSRGNHRIGLTKAQAREITMLEEDWGFVSSIGEGKHSKGVRRLIDYAVSTGVVDLESMFANSGLDQQCKLAIALLLDEHPKARHFARAVLNNLSGVKIKSESAIIESVLKNVQSRSKI